MRAPGGSLNRKVDLHFTDHFDVDPTVLREYGAFNISLINDLPLFIDPFLLFNSKRSDYQRLHEEIIRYLGFLRAKANDANTSDGLLRAWFMFHEVPQNWLGFSRSGNQGHGLGTKFARSLAQNLEGVFKDFGAPGVTRGTHLEKLTLIDKGVGKDGISDFATNLAKEYLLEYTQAFATNHIESKKSGRFHVDRVSFNYATESWASGSYELPVFNDDFVILTPRDILTRDDIWISRRGFVEELRDVIRSVANEELRTKLNNYLANTLPDEPTREDFSQAASAVAKRYPEILDFFIRRREDTGDRAVAQSSDRVERTAELFVEQVRDFTTLLASKSPFYETGYSTVVEARERALFLKDVVENKGGHRLFYAGGKPIRREADLHILYRLTWFATVSDISREVNDGRGPADFKVSLGASDKTIVEFKLASNTRLARNLEKQAGIYQKASDAQSAIKVIFYFSQAELEKVRKILRDLDMQGDENVILVDARLDNKPSGSKA